MLVMPCNNENKTTIPTNILSKPIYVVLVSINNLNVVECSKLADKGNKEARLHANRAAIIN